jgi:malonyl-CoA O-methyltransferase
MARFQRGLAARFSEAATHYEEHARMQWRITESLSKHAYPYLTDGKRILDAGCGTGFLKQCHPNLPVIGLDIAFGMCRESQKWQVTVQADMALLPFAYASFDTVFSSMAMQWLKQPEGFLKQLALTVTSKRGVLAFAVPVEGTFQELHAAYHRAGISSPVLHFKSVDEWQALLEQTGWRISLCKSEQEIERLSFTRLCRQISGIGASNDAHLPGNLGVAARLRKVRTAYESVYPNPERLPVTWNILYVIAQR